jgi:hypothetical protein
METMQKKNVSILIIVPKHISSKFNQEVLIFFDGGYGLRSEPSFTEGGVTEDESKSNPSPMIESNPKSCCPKPKSFSISIRSPTSDGKERCPVSL